MIRVLYQVGNRRNSSPTFMKITITVIGVIKLSYPKSLYLYDGKYYYDKRGKNYNISSHIILW